MEELSQQIVERLLARIQDGENDADDDHDYDDDDDDDDLDDLDDDDDLDDLDGHYHDVEQVW